MGIVYSVAAHSEPHSVGIFLLPSEAADNSAVSYFLPEGCRDVFLSMQTKVSVPFIVSVPVAPFIFICMSPDFSILGAFDEVAVFQQFARFLIQYCINRIQGKYMLGKNALRSRDIVPVPT